MGTFRDLTNTKLKYFTVTELAFYKEGQYYWNSFCNCGNKEKFIISTFELHRGHKKWCPKCRPKNVSFLELSGEKFARLSVIKFAFIKNQRNYWICKCDCGKETIASTHDLRNGNKKSCGCLKIAINCSRVVEFRKGSKNQKRFHTIWVNMLQRCTNSNFSQYMDYGGRGIKVCDRWLGFDNFIDLFPSYEDHVKEFGEKDTTIDRIDPNGNYEPGNVRWATREEQSNHRRCSVQSINIKAHNLWKLRISVSLINCIIKGQNSSIYAKYFGCSIAEMKKYIQSLWEPWMNWDNYGHHGENGQQKWHFGHIVGCNNFDLSKEEDRLVCWNYKNIKPQDSKENFQQSRILGLSKSSISTLNDPVSL